MNVLLDMNIPLKYAPLLAQRGVIPYRWSDIGAPNATDTAIMTYARENNFVVLTCDLDFSTILAVTHELKPSVAQIRASVLYAERAADLISSALLQYTNELEKGAILSIDLKGARIRLLPI